MAICRAQYKLRQSIGGVALAGVAGVFGFAGCSGDPIEEFQRRCDLVEKGLEPGSGLLIGQVIDPHSVDPVEVPDKINQVLDAWSEEVIPLKKDRRRIIKAEEYDAILARAAAKIGVTTPNCHAWSSYLERVDAWQIRVDNLEPLCKEYERRSDAVQGKTSSLEVYERLFQESVKAWKAQATWDANAVAAVDELAAKSASKRGRSIALIFGTYLEAPDIINTCDRLVNDSEYISDRHGDNATK